jgi:hypothetical protein
VKKFAADRDLARKIGSAFNALDKVGSYGSSTVAAHLYAPTQFGLELSMPMPFLAHSNR